MECDFYFFFARGADYVDISGFTFTRALWGGISANNGNRHIRISECVFTHIGNRPTSTNNGIVGIYLGMGTADIAVDRCRFDHIGRTGNDVRTMYNHDHGIYTFAHRLLVSNCLFYDQASGWDIQVSPGSEGLQIVNNTFHSGSNPGRCGSVELWGAHANIQILNNIFFAVRGSAIDRFEDREVGLVAVSNLVYPPPGRLVDETQGPLDGWTIGGTIIAAPLFANAAARDYRLNRASAANGSGLPQREIRLDYAGNLRPARPGLWDLGAFQQSTDEAAGPSSLFRFLLSLLHSAGFLAPT
jgi:hypothetical protein